MLIELLSLNSSSTRMSSIPNVTLTTPAEINFEQASKEAKELDEHLEKTGTVVGPMHGVPISVKVCLV